MPKSASTLRQLCARAQDQAWTAPWRGSPSGPPPLGFRVPQRRAQQKYAEIRTSSAETRTNSAENRITRINPLCTVHGRRGTYPTVRGRRGRGHARKAKSPKIRRTSARRAVSRSLHIEPSRLPAAATNTVNEQRGPVSDAEPPRRRRPAMHPRLGLVCIIDTFETGSHPEFGDWATTEAASPGRLQPLKAIFRELVSDRDNNKNEHH